MPDVHGNRERVARECADAGSHAVCQHDVPGVVMITRCMRAFDVLQVENIIGEPQRYSRCQVRQRMRNSLEQACNVHFRRIKAERGQCSRNRLRILQSEYPSQDGASNEQQKAGRDFLNIGDLPNQLIKMMTSTIKATIGVSNDCSIGFMASSSNPSPDKQDKRTVLGMTFLSKSPEGTHNEDQGFEEAPYQTDLERKRCIIGLSEYRNQHQKSNGKY